MQKSPSVEFSMVVTFSELFDFPPTADYATKLLKPFNLDSVLFLLAKLSGALRLWHRPNYADDNRLARQVFTRAGFVLEQRPPGNPSRIFFSRLGALATARLALTCCPVNGGDAITLPRQAADVMACCLMMNELIVDQQTIRDPGDLLVHQLPYQNSIAHYDFRGDLSRSLKIFEDNQNVLRAGKQTVDLRSEFQRATGSTPRDFIELCLVAGAPYRATSIASLVNDDGTYRIDKSLFSPLKIPTEALDAFFTVVAKTSKELANFAASQASRPLADTVIFQNWPMVRHEDEDRYYCLDLAGLMDKTGRGLYWTLFTSSDKPTRQKLGGVYGMAFENLLHDRANRAGLVPPQYLANPSFVDGSEVCDAIFVDGSSLVFCEYKSSVLTAEAKLSGDLKSLAAELDKKFILGGDDGKKGISQLSHSIARFLSGERIVGLPDDKWSMIFPVMVCLERAMQCTGMYEYMNQKFDRKTLRGRSRVRITPLTIADVEYFEDLLPDAKNYGLAELLDSYYHFQKVTPLRIQPFRRMTYFVSQRQAFVA
jgi:hypothetical protein